MGMEQKGITVKRRDFIKTTAIAGMAATLPVSSLLGQESVIRVKPSPQGKKRNLVFLTGMPENYGKLIESIKSIREYDFEISPVKADFQKPREIMKSLEGKQADVILMSLPGVGTSSRHIAEGMGTLDIPVILLPANPDLIMLETDLAAAFQLKGTNALIANSPERAMELLKIVAAPRVLEGKRALIFGKAFASTSVPAPNLSDDFVYRRTGVRIEYRPIEELKAMFEKIDEASARKEMERWKTEAAKIVEPSDQDILKSSKIYVLLRSIVDREKLDAISIDCLSYSFGRDTTIPTPCLAFTRLRDEGLSAPCEADVCMMLSSMLMQEISRKPSFVCNVSSVDTEKSTTVLRHCVAPTRFLGTETAPLPYSLRDYHGMGRGVAPELEFPIGLDITMGGFSKDLKNFVLWPGRIQPGAHDTETPSFENPPPGMEKMRRFCSNRAEVKIKNIDRFLRNVAGIHHIMVAGNQAEAIHDAMLRMNVNVIAPSDLEAPEV
jgi:L-fucose isomerase-like protein